MDIRTYIESGAIEAYVLGLATAEEAAELEQYRRQYPEVNSAIIAFEEQLERTAHGTSVAPPAFIKDQVTTILTPEFSRASGNGGPVGAAIVRPIWKYIAASALVLLVSSAALNIYLYNQYKRTTLAYRELIAETRTLQANNQFINTRLDTMEQSLRLVVDPGVQKVHMPGAGNNQQYNATVFWNTTSKDVYLLRGNLPQAPEGKQYQLWAMVDGKPVDAGMVDSCMVLCHMKPILRAQAFAITLERQGGSPTPDLSQLYVLGNTGS